jgi:hypothetical protein
LAKSEGGTTEQGANGHFELDDDFFKFHSLKVKTLILADINMIPKIRTTGSYLSLKR